MSKTLAIIASGFDAGTLSAAPDFAEVKLAAINSANAITQTVTPEEIAKGADAKRTLADLRIWIEKRRKEEKQRFLDWGRDVDKLAETLGEGIDKAEKRIQSMIDARQTEILNEQERIRAEADRAAKAIEDARIKAEQEALRLQQEAEATRQRAAQAEKDAETARLALEAATTQKAKAAAEKAQQDAAAREQQAKEDAAKIAAQQQVAEEEAEAAAMTPLPAAPIAVAQVKGVSAKKVFDYEIIGADNKYKEQVSLAEFAKAHPLLVTYAIRRQDVLDRLNGPGLTPTPGLRIVEKTKTSIR